MRISTIQTAPAILCRDDNIEHACRLLEQAKKTDIAVLPELFAAGYAFTSRDELFPLSEKAGCGPTSDALLDIASDNDMYIAAGFPERRGDALYNSQMLIGPEGLVEVYRKVHLFADEKRLFSPGNSLSIVDIPDMRLGMMVCFDWFFPEHMRSLALGGAELVLHSANLVMPYCPDAMVTRCLENRVYAATSNRVGTERGLGFIGMSQITAPDGTILSRASADAEEVSEAEIDLENARSKEINPANDIFADRRPDVYRL